MQRSRRHPARDDPSPRRVWGAWTPSQPRCRIDRGPPREGCPQACKSGGQTPSTVMAGHSADGRYCPNSWENWSRSSFSSSRSTVLRGCLAPGTDAGQTSVQGVQAVLELLDHRLEVGRDAVSAADLREELLVRAVVLMVPMHAHTHVGGM